MAHFNRFSTIQARLSRRDVLKRALVAGLSLTSASSLLQGCDTNTNAIKSSRNFGNWASAETATRANIDQALLAFEKQNNVQVNNIGMPFDEVLAQITALIRANITLYVMELSGNVPYVLAGMNALAPLINMWHESGIRMHFLKALPLVRIKNRSTPYLLVLPLMASGIIKNC